MDRPALPQIAPMLASDLRDLPEDEQARIWDSPDFVAEQKFDGIRCLLHIGSVENRLSTRVRSIRTGLYSEKSDHFLHLRDLPLAFLDGTILDGELILDKERLFTGKTWACGSLSCTMALLSASPQLATNLQANDSYATFWVFDIIRHCGSWVRHSPFWERRARLRGIFADMANRRICLDYLRLVPQTSTDKRAFYDSILAKGGEGVVLKNKHGEYKHEGRSSDVLKAKRSLTVDAFISGHTFGRNGNTGLVGSLLVSVYDPTGQVHEIAGVAPYDLSLGPKESNLRQEMTLLREGGPQLRPEYRRRVVELGALCWNKNHRLVHAKILRFRNDKAPEECIVNFSAVGTPPEQNS